ncbi:MAG: primosomal protein N' [Clostridium sp.]|nr:primosomal protein N' [Clostridium sp.]
MEGTYADVIVDISHEKVDRPFQYRIPVPLRRVLEVGMCVTVPFGNGNKPVDGYVIEIGEECRIAPEKIKEIQRIAPDRAGVEERLIRLAWWLRGQYGSTMAQALRTVLPAKRSVKRMEKKKAVRLLPREEILSLLRECERKKQTAKARLLRELAQLEAIPYEWITGKLGVSASAVKRLEQEGALKLVKESGYRNPVKIEVRREEEKELSPDQAGVVREILEDFDAGRQETYLLHGITGSGKTQIYLTLIEEVVRRGKQAIVLIPEIALTYQTLLRFYARFGERVSVMNSSLSQGEKYDQCERAKNGGIDVIIGPRSALFTPFPNIGLLILDEEHEGSYKSEGSPKYHARDTAREVARLHGASLVLGSATPSLESYYRVSVGIYKLFRLTKRLGGGTLPQVSIVDLREELRRGNRSVFSGKLQALLADRLSKGEQSMLFLNRRGYAGFLSCRSCGKVLKCPHCDVSLSEHQGGRLMCHYCGYGEEKPTLCPHCGSKYLSGFRAGTQQIEKKLKECYPGIRVLRMDADTTKAKDSYGAILSAFSNGEADVLVGTQMIVKGHDFPNVTLMGILAADLSLAASDYRAGERTFQLLTQAAGRAGRGRKPGEVVIQTYQPEHYALLHAARQDYDAFYNEEILYRELMSYPPISHMLAVQVFSKTEEDGLVLARRLAEKVRREAERGAQAARQEAKAASQRRAAKERLWVLGPAAAVVSKVNDVFRFVFYVKNIRYEKLVQVKDLLEGILKEWQPRSESVQFDFDPMNIL